MYINVIGKDMEAFRGKNIILFGCGSCGHRALEEFEKVKAHIIGFCDNNQNMAGKSIEGYKIFSPDQLKEYPEADIIITSTYEEEIKKQLTEMGLTNFYCIKLGVLREIIPQNQFHNKVLSFEEANHYLYDSLSRQEPFFAGRLGSVELECLAHYLYFLNRKRSKRLAYPGNVKLMMNINAGFFPCEDDLLDEFCTLYLKGLDELDLIWSMWFSKYEDMVYSEYLKEKPVTSYVETALPINLTEPWTEALRGKRVLVIHPFEQSVQENYRIIEKLFKNTDFMPNFELITLKAVQSIAGNKTDFSTWFEALKSMEQQMMQIDFDIVLIGAGAYGLPLGAFAKTMGKKAVHIGGMLQLFFGIKGKAWDKYNIYNEYWTSPKKEETPDGYRQVEAGRYW